jgi:hypothetical protein
MRRCTLTINQSDVPVRIRIPIKAWWWFKEHLKQIEDGIPALDRILALTTPFYIRQALERAGLHVGVYFDGGCDLHGALNDFTQRAYVVVPDEFESYNDVNQAYVALLILMLIRGWRSVGRLKRELEPLTPLREIARAAG